MSEDLVELDENVEEWLELVEALEEVVVDDGECPELVDTLEELGDDE